jgi:hypothetical protein
MYHFQPDASDFKIFSKLSNENIIFYLENYPSCAINYWHINLMYENCVNEDRQNRTSMENRVHAFLISE